MKIGTADTLPASEEDKKKSPRSSITGGNGSGKGGNGGPRKDNDGGGGGSDIPPSAQELAAAASIQKYRISMWVAIGVAFMTFGGLIAAYAMLAANPQLEWRPFDLPFQLWISTALILISSGTYEFGRNNLVSEHQTAARNWMVATSALGAIFIASQLMAWLELINRGVYMSGNPYAGFFYILTAVHAAHVVGGMGALGYVLLRIWHPTRSKELLQRRISTAQISGWFWHFLGILWVVIFMLLGFWK